MNKYLRSAITPIFRKFGCDFVDYRPTNYDDLSNKIHARVQDYTMTTLERVNALVEAIKYIEKNNIAGSLVECGVWKGGSIMAMALTLKELGNTTRDIYLYDTFEGMNAPTKEDVLLNGESAEVKFSKTKISDDSSTWCMCPIEKVKKNVLSTGYPEDKIHFIKGTVETTIPSILPDKIALLRLDTDWYESTKHEMKYLYPILSNKGILIIDDYGQWQGAKQAIDEYIAENDNNLFLNRIDYTGRIGIKI